MKFSDVKYKVLILFDFTFLLFHVHVCFCVYISQQIQLGTLSRYLAG